MLFVAWLRIPSTASKIIRLLNDTKCPNQLSALEVFGQFSESLNLGTQKQVSVARLVSWQHPKAPIAQGIEHRPPEAGAQVRILLGALPLRQKTRHLVHGHCPVRKTGFHFRLKLRRRNLKTLRNEHWIVAESPITGNAQCY
jgi:hypothetical protein